MKIRRRPHPDLPAKRTTPRDPKNPRNPTGERMFRNPARCELYNSKGDIVHVAEVQAEVNENTLQNAELMKTDEGKEKLKTKRLLQLQRFNETKR